MGLTQRGFVLLEAIIALVVSAVGLLGVALFTSSMVGESSNAKSEAEALAIAQREIEILREYAGSYSLGSIVSNTPSWPVSSAVSGTRETYSISGDVAWSSSVGTSLADASITVSWAEGSVTLNTTIVEDMFDSKAEGANNDGPAGSNPFSITPPTGGAKYGEDALGGNLPEAVTLSGDQIAGVKVRPRAGGGVELVYVSDDESSYELLTYTGSAFSEIRGAVYVDADMTGLSSSEYKNLYIRASDTGVCPRSDAHLIPDSSDWFVEYRCFFGAGWYGNIDVLYYKDGGNPESVRDHCVGDPNISDDGTDLSRHPNLISVSDPKREYRGYGLAVTTNGNYESDSSGNLKYVAQGLSEGAVYGYGIASEAGQSIVLGDGNHDFVLVKSITADSECGTEMSGITIPSYSGHFPGTDNNSGAFGGFNSNNGDFVCLEVNGSFSCPANIPESFGSVASAATYTISGTISQASISTLVSTATSQFPSGVINNCIRDGDGSLSCTSEPICTNTNSSYSCSVIAASGASWSGQISHALNDEALSLGLSICSPAGGLDSSFNPLTGNASGAVLEISDNCPSPSGDVCQVTISGGLSDKQRASVSSDNGLVCETYSAGSGSYSCSNENLSFYEGTVISVTETLAATSKLSSSTSTKSYTVDCDNSSPIIDF